MKKRVQKYFREVVQGRLYRFYFLARVAYRLHRSRRNIRLMLRAGIPHRLAQWDHRGCRSSDTLFVLGSGPSVADLSPRAWERIRSRDSVGLNFWVIHDFVPSFCLCELAGPAHLLARILTLKERQYQGVPVILKGNYLSRAEYGDLEGTVSQLPESVRRHCYLAVDFPIPGDTVENFRRSLGWLAGRGLFEPRSPLGPLCQARGTLFSALVLALQMGYTQVVLCGVDLKSSHYFFNDDPRYLNALGVPAPHSGAPGVRHSTDLRTWQTITISEALGALKELVLDPRGIGLSVADSGSALYPMLPVYEW